MNIEATAGKIMRAIQSDAFDEDACEQILRDAQVPRAEADDQQALKEELRRRGLDADKTTLEIEAKINRHLEERALPCPFCGSDEIQLNPIADGSWTLDCHTCGAGCGTNDKEFVLEAWNKRAAQPKPESWQEIAREAWNDLANCPCSIGSAGEIAIILAAIERSHAAQPQSSEGLSEEQWEKVREAERRFAQHSSQPPANATDDKQEWRVIENSVRTWDIYSGDHKIADDISLKATAEWICAEFHAAFAAEREKVEHLKRELKLSNDALAPTQQELYKERQRREQLIEQRKREVIRDGRLITDLRDRLLSALAAIEKKDKLLKEIWSSPYDSSVIPSLHARAALEIKVDLSALREHDAEVRNALVLIDDALAKVKEGK